MADNKKVLVVVDMQNDFIDGSLGTPEAQTIVGKIANKIARYSADPDARIIFTRDTHHPGYLDTQEGRNLPVEHCLEDSPGWQIRDGLLPASGNVRVIDKPSFGYTGWADEQLGGCDIELVGLCTDICVVSNVLILKAVYPETPITVDASCCAGVTPARHEAALDTMESCQVRVVNR